MTNWTALLQAVRKYWRRERTIVAERPIPVRQLERRALHVPAEYLSLHTYLDRRYASMVVLTFEQMEALMGSALPAAALTERDWWTGAAIQAQHHSAAWMGAGRSAVPNLPARTVTFERL